MQRYDLLTKIDVGNPKMESISQNKVLILRYNKPNFVFFEKQSFFISLKLFNHKRYFHKILMPNKVSNPYYLRKS